jgi:CheY-like chemotaxis protein
MEGVGVTLAKKRPTRKRTGSRAKKQPLILVVDDFPAAREMYGRFLSYSGFRVEEASGGPEAVEKGIALKPALVVMDLAMPGMDGWEAIRRLKADPATHDVRIVVVTGAAYGGGARKAKEAGCDAYLVKPCLPETLLGVVRRLLGAEAG